MALVPKFSFIGVAIGTTIAMAYRTMAQVVYTKKNILHRPIVKFVKSVLVFAAASASSFILCKSFITVGQESYVKWALSAVPVTVITLAITLILSWLFYPSELKRMLSLRRTRSARPGTSSASWP